MNYFHYEHPFILESGAVLSRLTVAYHTYGQLNEEGNNAVWICHALTANSDVATWWPGMVGPGKAFDTDRHYIVCANILGSCYGTTGPVSINPVTSTPYFEQFPLITIRDMARAHQLLREFLGIKKIHLLVGGSMGGYQALEWSLLEPTAIEKLFLLVTAARETAWGIAIHTAQRLAIEADPSWGQHEANAGEGGLKAARAIAMLTYRNYTAYVQQQTDTDSNKLEHFKAESYIRHQGNKLAGRFNAYTYWTLGKAMDSHNIARGRGKTIAEVLQSIQQPVLLVGIVNDLLCPLAEIEFLDEHLPNSTLRTIQSVYGHDGFLTEHEAITGYVDNWSI
jgi:homoserine O-acetyltransferase